MGGPGLLDSDDGRSTAASRGCRWLSGVVATSWEEALGRQQPFKWVVRGCFSSPTS
jgi:hypothetical protein